jgi:flavin reductase (DIM6/NTAB) family NADH-FMN oxidoreductase RutF
MRTIDLTKACRLLYGNPVFLVTTRHTTRSNVMTLTSSIPIRTYPPTIGISVRRSSLTHRFIEETGEFILNVPDLGILDIVHACGVCSGRDVDKFRVFELTAQSSRIVKPMALLDCIATLECEIRDIQRHGYNTLFIAEVLYASADDDRFDKRWRPDAYTLHHLGGKTYLSNGKIYVPKKPDIKHSYDLDDR